MELTAAVIKRGFVKGITVTIELAKIVVPVYILVTFLKYTPALNYIAGFFEPVMKLAGLPGTASIVLVLGLATNLYAAIGAIVSLSLSAKETTIIAMMLLIAHSLPMEGAVIRKTGVSGLFISLVRLAVAAVVGVTLNLIL